MLSHHRHTLAKNCTCGILTTIVECQIRSCVNLATRHFYLLFFSLYCLYFFVWFHFKGAPRMHAFVGIKWLQEIHNTSLRCWIVLLLLLQLLLLLPNRNELDSVIPYLSSTTRPSPTSEPFSYTVFVTWFYFLIFPIFFRLGRQNDLWNYPKSHVNLLTDSLFYSFFCFPIS